MKLDEPLATLEDMIYNYNCVDEVEIYSDGLLKEIYDYCRSNPPTQLTEGSCRCSSKRSSKKPTGKPPAPKPKSQFVPGDLLNCKKTTAQFVFIKDLGADLLLVFNLDTKELDNFHKSWFSIEKKKQTVLSAPELVKHFEDNGYKFIESSTGNWGWSNQSLSVPNFFNVEMFQYCGKEPTGFNWRLEWLK